MASPPSMEVEEPWEITIQGTKYYTAAGTRDVLILVSSKSGTDIVARKKGELIEKDKKSLKSEGIPSHCWEDDAMMARERYTKGSEYIKSVNVEDTLHMKSKEVLEKIIMQFNNNTQHGVILHYIGPGKKDTGDWCFNEGFVTFKEIVDLYTQHFTGKTLYLMCDCSYSGKWVESCKEFLDTKGVQPCGHSAMKTGIKMKVFCSCQPDQIGYSLLCSARAGGNDKNHGIPYLKNPVIQDPDQHTCVEDFTEIMCGKLPNEECALPRNITFREKKKRSRIELVPGEERGLLPMWRYVIPESDLDTKSTFEDMALEGREHTRMSSESDHKVTLISGLGKEPPQKIRDWVTGVKNGMEDLPSPH